MKLEEFLEKDLRNESGACKTIASIVKKGHSIGRKFEDPCEKCGEEEVYCGWVDLGLVDWYNNYWHICLSCLDAKHTEDYSGATQETGAEGICDFCGWNHRLEEYAGFARKKKEK